MARLPEAEIQLRHVFWLSTIGLTAIARLTAPFAGVMASFYTHDQDVKEVIVILIWLNAAFMPIWAASGCYQRALKVREMHVLLCGYRCWACGAAA